MNTQHTIRRVLAFFVGVLRQRWGQVSILMACRVIGSIIPMIIPRYYGQFVQTIAEAGHVDPTIVATLRSILLAVIAWYLLEFVAWRVLEYVIVRLETSQMKVLYQQCFDYLHQHSYKFFANNFTGALVKKVNKLVKGYEAVVDIALFEISGVFVSLTALLFIAWSQHWLLATFFAVWICLYSILQYVMYKRIMPDELASQKHDSKVTAALADTITNHYNIDTFASLLHEHRRFGNICEAWRVITQRSWSKKNMIYAVNSALMTVGEFAIFGLIIHLWSQGVMGTGMIVAMQIYILQLFDRIFFIGKAFKRLFGAITESAEMIEILDTPLAIQDQQHAPDLTVDTGAISIENISFGYHEEQGIFGNFSLAIEPGQKIALVGPSGSGKSTLVKLLLRFFDLQAGRILIDGQDISTVTQTTLRSSIAVVPQDPILFHRSLAENISYGRPDASMDEIIHAAELAQCHGFITGLPQGYATLVGERGIKLSGGERQRVAIARAILEDKQILVMDEATSSLDSASEQAIQQAIQALIQDKTAIIIAHRLSTIKAMDSIVVLEHGQLVEQGRHEQLVTKDGSLYRHLWELQSLESA